jgi:hypothetical protein
MHRNYTITNELLFAFKFMTNYTDTDKDLADAGADKNLATRAWIILGCLCERNILDVGAKAGAYNDLAGEGADREGAGAQKYLAFGGADMDLAHAGANKNFAQTVEVMGLADNDLADAIMEFAVTLAANDMANAVVVKELAGTDSDILQMVITSDCRETLGWLR